jgi:hypothetical protein
MGKRKSKVRHKPMSKEVLATWRENMGYSARDCAHELGCTAEDWAAWEEGAVTIPRYVGLACAALAMGMEPYKG